MLGEYLRISEPKRTIKSYDLEKIRKLYGPLCLYYHPFGSISFGPIIQEGLFPVKKIFFSLNSTSFPKFSIFMIRFLV